MTLWGNNDNKLSSGTVSLNYGNKTVTGTGTTFGVAGNAVVGNVIRFGSAFGGTTGFFGDAVIASIGGTQSLTVHSTAGLSGGQITDQSYQISESPKYLPTDSAQNQSSGSAQLFELKLISNVPARVAVAATVVNIAGNASGNNVVPNDRVLIEATSSRYQYATVHSVIGLSTVNLLAPGVLQTDLVYHTPNNFPTAPIGFSTIIVTERAYGDDPDTDPVTDILAGDAVSVGTNSGLTISTVNQNFFGQRELTLSGTLTQEVVAGAVVTISRGIAPGGGIRFGGTETLEGKESQVVGVADTGMANAANTSYALTASGWVGVTTYTDNEGVARVKSETFVAMSGIQTGNTPYPPA